MAGVLFAIPVPGQDRTVSAQPAKDGARADFTTTVRPLIEKYCLGCHSTKLKQGSLDLERFTTLDDIRKDLKPWQSLIEQIEAGEMPPKEKPQPTAEEKKRLLAWVRRFLDAEARAHSGDPGRVPLRRLSNAEYNYTIRDLTGVDLQPAREFPADGAAGEGFTNAAEALTDISPALFIEVPECRKGHRRPRGALARRLPLLACRRRAATGPTRGPPHCGGFTPRSCRAMASCPCSRTSLATVRHRDALTAGKFAEVAAKEKLNAKYLGVLWQALSDESPSQPLDAIRAKWRTATEKDVPALAADIAAWQAALWRTVKVGNYVQASWNSPDGYTESLTRQVAADPQVADSVPLRLAVKPAPGQSEIVLYLAAREPGMGGPIVWQRPRFEARGKPTFLLRDYSQFGPAFEVDYPSVFATSAKYLAAAVESANDRKLSVEDLARKHALDAAFLKRWNEVLAVEPFRKEVARRRSAAPCRRSRSNCSKRRPCRRPASRPSTAGTRRAPICRCW